MTTEQDTHSISSMVNCLFSTVL